MSQSKTQKPSRDGKHKEGKSLIHIWIEDETITDIDEYAQKQKVNRSEVIRTAISKLLRGDVPAAKEPSTIDMIKMLENINGAIAKRDTENAELKAKAAALSNPSDENVKKTILLMLSLVSSLKTNEIAVKLKVSPAQVFIILSSLELAGDIKGENDNWSLI